MQVKKTFACFSRRLSLIVIAVACATGAAVAQSQIDQSNAPSWTGAAVNIAPVNRVSQTFVPTMSCLVAVEAGLKTGNRRRGGDQVKLNILDSGGKLLATRSANIPEGFDGFWRFDLLGGGISVQPGQPVTIQLEDTNKIVFWWKYKGGNPYQNGQALFNGAPFKDNDLYFKTYGAKRCIPPRGACIDFEAPTFASGQRYGAPSQSPGSLAFTWYGVSANVRDFNLLTPGKTAFGFASIVPCSKFGNGQCLNVNNVNLEFDFTSFVWPILQVTLDLKDLGGIENLSVNGSPVYVGDLSSTPQSVGGANVHITTTPIAGGKTGKLVVNGRKIKSLKIGGQEFAIDNVCPRGRKEL